MRKVSDYRYQRLYPNKFLKELTKQTRSYVTIDVKYPKFIFLCGKNIDSKEPPNNRSWVQKFFKKHDNSIICIFAENLWEKENKAKALDLLTYESFLAEASDAILLFVESYGTACELGAFTIKDDLAKKMIVFNDSRYEKENSFLTEGPIKKIKNKNPNNVIYTDIKGSIFLKTEVYKKLQELINMKKEIKINRDKNKVRINAFIIEILELISLLGPITQKDVLNVYKDIKHFNPWFYFVTEANEQINIQMDFIFNLLTNAGLIIKRNDNYTIGPSLDRINFMLNLDNIKFSSLRAKFLSRKFKYDKESIFACREDRECL